MTKEWLEVRAQRRSHFVLQGKVGIEPGLEEKTWIDGKGIPPE